jgi:hypothetical protein
MFPLRRSSAAARLLLACSALSAAVALLPFNASATAIQVSYTVTGGSFSTNNVVTEAIQSGAFTYIVPVLGTNTMTFTATATPILQALVLVGTNGYTFALPPQFFLGGASAHTANSAQISGFLLPLAFGPLYGLHLNHTSPFPVSPFGLGQVSFATYSYATKKHIFITSNEVRSVVPEPGTGLLMGAGLAGLAVAGRFGGARARRRLARAA